MLVAGLVVVAFAWTAGWLAKIVPTGFSPEEDQGLFFAEAQLPDATSLNRTNRVVGEVENMILERPWTQSVLTVSSYNLPPIAGLGNVAGFELQLQTLSGATSEDLAAVADGLVIAANQNPALANVYTTYGASTPQVYLKLDREHAETLGVSIGDIFSALQTTMGGTYISDFNRFGRPWQVKVQADASDRKGVDDIFRSACPHRARRFDPTAGCRRCRRPLEAPLSAPPHSVEPDACDLDIRSIALKQD